MTPSTAHLDRTMTPPNAYPVWITPTFINPNDDHYLQPVVGGWTNIGYLNPHFEATLAAELAHPRHPEGRQPRIVDGYITTFCRHPWVADIIERHPLLTWGYGAQNTTEHFWIAFDITRSTPTAGRLPKAFSPPGSPPPPIARRSHTTRIPCYDHSRSSSNPRIGDASGSTPPNSPILEVAERD